MREIAEVVLVIGPVADQGAADEIAAGELDEHDRSRAESPPCRCSPPAPEPSRGSLRRPGDRRRPDVRRNRRASAGRGTETARAAAPGRATARLPASVKVPGTISSTTSRNRRPGAVASTEARAGPAWASGVRGGRQCTRAGRLQLFNHTIPFQNDPRSRTGAHAPLSSAPVGQVPFYRNAFSRKAILSFRGAINRSFGNGVPGCRSAGRAPRPHPAGAKAGRRLKGRGCSAPRRTAMVRPDLERSGFADGEAVSCEDVARSRCISPPATRGIVP